MSHADAGLLAVRLIGVCAATLVLPGLALLAFMKVNAEWPERILLGFSISYSWVFVVSVVVPLLGWSVDHGAAATVVLIAATVAATIRRRDDTAAVRPHRAGSELEWIVVVLVAAGAVGAWFIEPPVTGEEALDLASISKFADGGPITFQNTSVLPDARPVYLFQPYQLAVGTIARWSGTDPIVAFVKLRTFLVPLSLIFVYALLRRLTPTRGEAVAAFVAVAAFIVLDIRTWEATSLFPYVRRGGFSAGVCIPALMFLCLAATRRADDATTLLIRRIALWTTPLMVAASLSTHPLEILTLLCFAAAVGAVVLVGADPGGDSRRAWTLLLVLATVVSVYLLVQARAVPYVADFERQRKLVLWSQLYAQVSDMRGSIMGPLPEGARELLSRAVPSTVAGIVGVPALGLAVLRMPAAAALLTAGILPLTFLYATIPGYTLLALLTSDATVQDASSYFALLGLLALALGLVAAAQAALNTVVRRQEGFARVLWASAIGSVVLWAAWAGGQRAVTSLITLAVVWPRLLLVIGALVFVGVLTLARARPQPLLGTMAFPLGVVLVTGCLASALVTTDWSFRGVFEQAERMTVFRRLEEARTSPSVLDWPAYYDTLRESLSPPLPLPASVVGELRRVLPPRQVLLADPHYSCALVVLVDAYCINPEFIYGHHFLPAARYLDVYVDSAGGRAPEHPFFNASPSLSAAERQLLADYDVSYVLADPDHADAIDGKLRETGINAIVEINRDGYVLYRLRPS
jgi:hypothetical protein